VPPKAPNRSARAIPDGRYLLGEDPRGYGANVFELLQVGRQLRATPCLLDHLCHVAVAPLQFLAHLEQFRRGGEVVARIVCFIEQADQFVPARIQHFVGTPQTRGHQPGVCAFGDFLLDRLAKEQAGQEPLERLFLFPRRQIYPQLL